MKVRRGKQIMRYGSNNGVLWSTGKKGQKRNVCGTLNDDFRKGSDTLQGGLNNDTCKIGGGNGWDWIEDKDGLGSPLYTHSNGGKDTPLIGGTSIADHVWKQETNGKTFWYLLSDWTENGETFQRLAIEGSEGGAWIKGRKPGQLGITLPEAPPAPTPTPADVASITDGSTWYKPDHTILHGVTDGAQVPVIGAYGKIWVQNLEHTQGSTLIGNAWNNRLLGDAGNDTLTGNEGRDTLLGDAGNDKIYGGLGDDALAGGLGAGVLYGGTGADYLMGEGGYQALHANWSVTKNADGSFYFQEFQGYFELDGYGASILWRGGNNILWGGGGENQGEGSRRNENGISSLFSEMLRSTGKNGQKRNVSGPFDRFDRSTKEHFSAGAA